jgi:hypothetical protein
MLFNSYPVYRPERHETFVALVQIKEGAFCKKINSAPIYNHVRRSRQDRTFRLESFECLMGRIG